MTLAKAQVYFRSDISITVVVLVGEYKEATFLCTPPADIPVALHQFVTIDIHPGGAYASWVGFTP